MSIPIIGAALELAAKLIKGKKPYCLWYQGMDMKWRMKGGPFSYRQCRKTRKALEDTGFEGDRFGIFRKGVDPNKAVNE